MGKRTQKDQKNTEGNRRNERTNNKTARKNKAGRKQKQKAPEPVTADLIKIVMDHYFPDFNRDLGKLPDPRLGEKIIYSKEHLFYLGLSMFLFHCGSRNQLESERQTIAFYHNLREPDLGEIAMNPLCGNIIIFPDQRISQLHVGARI
jgi:hypothetical protein